LGYRVLIVEDEAVVAVGVVSMVQDAGHEVVEVARSGEEALEIAADKRPDVAIVDIRLPGINGIETTRQLVEKHNTAVVILTAYSDPEFVEGAAGAGAFTYLLKPVTKEALRANLELAAARSSEFAELRREANDLRTALEVRKLSERAKHVLMGRLALSEADAFAHLKQKCRNQNKTLREASEEILAADEAFLDEIAKDPPKRPRVEV
jgi:AmiR/NasT family two-component response regulator